MSYNEYRPTRNDYEFYKFISTQRDLKSASFRLIKTKDLDNDYYVVLQDGILGSNIYAYTVKQIYDESAGEQHPYRYSVDPVATVGFRAKKFMLDIEWFSTGYNYQNKGIGKKLMDCAKTFAAYNGLSRIELQAQPTGKMKDYNSDRVIDSVEAHRKQLNNVYASLGFKETSRHSCYSIMSCNIDIDKTIEDNPEFDFEFFKSLLNQSAINDHIIKEYVTNQKHKTPCMTYKKIDILDDEETYLILIRNGPQVHLYINAIDEKIESPKQIGNVSFHVNRDNCYICDFITDINYQRRGIGKMMMNCVKTLCAHENIDYICLNQVPDGPMRDYITDKPIIKKYDQMAQLDKVYESMGFTILNPHYYEHPFLGADRAYKIEDMEAVKQENSNLFDEDFLDPVLSDVQ